MYLPGSHHRGAGLEAQATSARCSCCHGCLSSRTANLHNTKPVRSKTQIPPPTNCPISYPPNTPFTDQCSPRRAIRHQAAITDQFNKLTTMGNSSRKPRILMRLWRGMGREKTANYPTLWALRCPGKMVVLFFRCEEDGRRRGADWRGSGSSRGGARGIRSSGCHTSVRAVLVSSIQRRSSVGYGWGGVGCFFFYNLCFFKSWVLFEVGVGHLAFLLWWKLAGAYEWPAKWESMFVVHHMKMFFVPNKGRQSRFEIGFCFFFKLGTMNALFHWKETSLGFQILVLTSVVW